MLTIKTKDKVEILNEIDKLSYETGYNYKYIKSSTKSKIVMKFLCANQRFIEQDGILIPKNSKTSMALSNEITTNLLGKKRLEDSEIENVSLFILVIFKRLENLLLFPVIVNATIILTKLVSLMKMA